jgi:hypothetical protein
LRWYGPPPCAAAHHVSKQAPVTQHALPKRFGLVSLRTAPHSQAPAPSRSEPRHKTLAGLNMLMAGLGPAATPVGISANRNTNHLGLHRTAGFP